ncbi:Protein ZNRD2 [Cichlidogyrus casuarinus]|uniref:Protein ZNRD2 n=1 Tax=Cichlidogyrus casuarinus TaxID=1844966 RepID=A0ABD2Q6B2_9PLAT
MADASHSTFSPAASFRLVDAQSRGEKPSGMGEYLLRGWIMLNDACDKCGTILLQSKAGKKICVGCREDPTEMANSRPSTPGFMNGYTSKHSTLPRTSGTGPPGHDLRQALREKVNFCMTKLVATEDPVEIERWAKSIDSLGKAASTLDFLYS